VKDGLEEFYSVTLKLPLRLLLGVTNRRRKTEFHNGERSFVRSVRVGERTVVATQERAQVVLCYVETKSFNTVQGNYWRVCGGDAKTIKAWFDKFLPTGIVLKQSGGMT
jgi:hypothetical protein